MTRKRAKSADQTSLETPGTTETAAALRSPPRPYGKPRRLLSSAPFQSSSGQCRLKGFLMKHGMTKSELAQRPYRHDLVKLLHEAKRHGLTLSSTQNPDGMIEWINKLHGNGAEIRYDFSAEQSRPLCNAIFPLAEEIIAASKALPPRKDPLAT